MESASFESKLVNHKIFKDVKESLNVNPSGKLRNLIEIRDDILFLWNTDENCLLCLNLKRLDEHDDETEYQKLHFVSPPSFPVERLVSSACGSRICVWGSRGATVAQLPARWGYGGPFDAQNTQLCKSYSLDERFLYCQAEVRKVAWHPNSLSHLLVLVSDNTMRLYNIALKTGPKLLKVFTIGQKPHCQLAGRQILDSLGDTAVDFTATPDCESLLILRGNGDVYMMTCNLDEKEVQAKITGPLAMYPPADDNYGTDSCSILAVGGVDCPPLVVIASCSAAVYHCLLLPQSSEESGDSHALYVVETVELDIALSSDEEQHSYPVHLYQCGTRAYACAHAHGAHEVSLPVLDRLAAYAQADDLESESAVGGIVSARAVARHVACAGAPPAGLAVLRAPPRLLLLTGTVFLRTLEPYDLEEQLFREIQLKNPALEQDEIDSILKERQKVSFTWIISEILRRGASQPLLDLQNTRPSTRRSLEVLTQATLTLRSEYICRQARALDALARKLAALRALADQHRANIQATQKDVEQAMLKSEQLREQCALAEKRQEDIKYRCSKAIRAARGAAPPTAGELALLSELQALSRAAAAAADRLPAARDAARQAVLQRKEWEAQYKRKDIALGKSHSDTISSILQQQTSLISTLIEETKLLKDQLSIV